MSDRFMFHLKSSPPGIARHTAQIFFNTQKLIVFGIPISSRKRTSLDLAGVCCDRKVSDKWIFRLTRTMRDNRGSPVGFRELNAVKGLGESSNLIYFDQN